MTLTTVLKYTIDWSKKKKGETFSICRVQNLLGLLLRLPLILTFFVSYRAGRLADRSMTSDGGWFDWLIGFVCCMWRYTQTERQGVRINKKEEDGIHKSQSERIIWHVARAQMRRQLIIIVLFSLLISIQVIVQLLQNADILNYYL